MNVDQVEASSRRQEPDFFLNDKHDVYEPNKMHADDVLFYKR